MQRCPSVLPLLTTGTGEDVALTMSEWAAQYQRCATRHNGLVNVLEETP
ncbi:hypothetical protein [Halomonas sp. GD1P12]|nr:hypothetical protein [Halomonas sp. GD1P12]UYF99326.1 hypothetical protein OCT39_13975 [Halomonas sp. GD1P12]